MSVKRQATTELNHENWDKEDPVNPDEMGTFKIASKDILEKRVIRTAKRRTQVAGDEPKKGVFSGFGGFNKAKPASFDFLSKITNGSENNSSTTKADSSVTSSLFTSKPLSSNPGTGLFSLQTSAGTSPIKSPSTLPASSSLFGLSTSNASPNMFMTSKADSTVGDSPFKIQTVTSSTDSKMDSSKSTTTSASMINFKMSTSSTNSQPTTINSEPFKMKPVTNTVQNFHDTTKKGPLNSVSDSSDDGKTRDKKMEYYSKLTGLNESVAEWIKTHVEETPLCILTPIFKDYEKYLKEIQDDYQNYQKDSTSSSSSSSKLNQESLSGSSMSVFTATKSTFTKSSDINTKDLFASSSSNNTVKEPSMSFSFGNKATTTAKSPSASLETSTGTKSPSSGPSPFFFPNTTATVTTASTTPFSFGIGKPFSFNSNVTQSNIAVTNQENKEDDEDIPPKVEYKPVVEENSVYDKKCKIFVKKDGNFVDKGVGTLYIKKVEESGKNQLLVRANTNLGTVLVNLILVADIPTQKMGKNNVMMVCIPTPDSKPPPTPILIRVKTSEEADELLETLNKYKT